MMLMISTVSLVSSLMLWAGYQAFFVPDKLHPSSAQARNALNDLSPPQEPPQRPSGEDGLLPNEQRILSTRSAVTPKDSSIDLDLLNEDSSMTTSKKGVFNQDDGDRAEDQHHPNHNVAIAKLLSDQLDDLSKDHEPTIKDRNPEKDLHSDESEEMVITEDSHPDQDNGRTVFEDHHTLEKHQSQLLENAQTNVNPLVNQLHVLYSLAGCIGLQTKESHCLPTDLESTNNGNPKGDGGINASVIQLNSSKHEPKVTVAAITAKVEPQAAVEASSTNLLYNKSPLDTYLNLSGWEAYVIISVCGIIALLLITSLILFGASYCNRHNRGQQSKKVKGVHADKTI